ncbi:MAG: peptide chain release factor 3, partial [Acidimicrobiales bacterium]
DFVRYPRTARGASEAPEEIVDPARAEAEEGELWLEAKEGVELFDVMERNFDAKRFEAGELSPVFFGSALTNFGVRMILDAMVDLVPSPSPRIDENGQPRPLEDPFSGIIFKVQANMDKAHRDRVAFMRVCSGEFERGMVVTHGPTGKPFATKYAHTVSGQDRETVEEAYPGDVVGLVNA